MSMREGSESSVAAVPARAVHYMRPGFTSSTPYIIVKNAAAAITFYEKAFGAKEEYRLAGPDGQIGHAELVIGAGRLMLPDENAAFGALSPPSIGGTPITVAEPDSPNALVFRGMAARIWDKVGGEGAPRRAPPRIVIE